MKRKAAAAALVLAALILGDAGRAQDEDSLPEPIERTIRGFFVGPVRYRHEYRDDHDLRADIDDGDNRDLLKVGFGLDARPIDLIRGRVQLRYTRSWGRNIVNPALAIDPFGQDHLDIFEAFGEVGPVEGVPLSVRVGRQVLAYGEERLVGPLEFIQNARTWDAVKIIFAGESAGADLWWGRRVQYQGPDDHNANQPVDTVDFFGLYGYLRLVADLTIEPFYLAKYDDNHEVAGERGRTAHHILRHSPGVHAVFKAPGGLTVGADAAVQLGERARDDILAWGAGARATWRAPEWLRPLFELETEYYFASGDTNPRDGDVNTFDNFYPTNHRFYGEIDFVGWQNIHALELTARAELYRLALRDPPAPLAKGEKPPLRCPLKKVPDALVPPTVALLLEVGAHSFWLATPNDAWYNAALVPVRRDPTGDASRELGQEIDVVLRAGPIAIAYAHFFPGEFVRDTTPAGGNTSGADLFYAELLFSF